MMVQGNIVTTTMPNHITTGPVGNGNIMIIIIQNMKIEGIFEKRCRILECDTWEVSQL